MLESQKPVLNSGPPKRTDRKLVTAMVSIATGIVLALIAFAFFSDFPGPSQDKTNNPNPPPEDVSRAGP
jgi:hypothetical protein